MDNIPASQPNVVSATAPATPPAPTPAPAPIVATPSVVMADGGTTASSSGDSGLKGFLSSLNWVEVIIASLGVAALTYTIFYYRFKLKQDKMINSELQRQIDELKMNMQSAMKGRYKTL